MLSVAYAECLALYDEHRVLNVVMLRGVTPLKRTQTNQDPNGMIVTASFDDILPIFS